MLWHSLPGTMPTSAWTDALLRQLVIGAAMGFGIQIIVLGCSMAGQWISDVSGMGASTTGGESLESPSLAGLYRWIAAVAFIAINGPGRAVTAILDSFQSIPVSGQPQVESMTNLLVNLIQQSFLLAIKIGLPVIACIILATIVVSLLSRTVTNSSLFQFQLAGNWIVALFVMAATLAGSMWLMGNQFDALFDVVTRQVGVEH